MRGQPYVVGERGPELMIPDASGRVISNADLQRMTVNSTHNYNISMPYTGQPATDAQFMSHTASILRRMETL